MQRKHSSKVDIADLWPHMETKKSMRWVEEANYDWLIFFMDGCTYEENENLTWKYKSMTQTGWSGLVCGCMSVADDSVLFKEKVKSI